MNAQRISWMTGRRKTLSTLPATINEFRDGTNTNGLTKRMPQKVTKSILLHTVLIYVCMACISQTWYWVKAVWHVLILIFYWVELMFNFALSSPSVEEKKKLHVCERRTQIFLRHMTMSSHPNGPGCKSWRGIFILKENKMESYWKSFRMCFIYPVPWISCHLRSWLQTFCNWNDYDFV